MKNCNILYVVRPESFILNVQFSNTFEHKYSMYVLLFIVCIVWLMIDRDVVDENKVGMSSY